MALPDITQRLKLQAEGVKETETSSANIHKNLAGAAKAADALTRAQSDSRRKAAAQLPRENLEYNQMRGTAGVTGAASRDFAEQSRGLGGLVRLYATFAANIFAVSAAFNVLRNAADTTNLVAGLNTLGATSGRALGTLAKQLADVSDGAISLREAMTSTAMTSSAGMSSQNILRLGAVAKNASIALGISMPDAINRLSRGIVKLEPELLDELGLFTKIEPATQAYALQLGKAASQLTDFERRQAFANAVLKEGEDKFSALAEAAANPYDKLLAGLKNTAQSGLELINKVLIPIVDLLAKSPTALALGLGAVVALLLRQAVPAITQLRAGLAAAADDALKEAKGKAGDALRAREQLNKLIEARVEQSADNELRILEEKEAQLEGLKKKGYKVSEGLNNALKKDIVDLTNTELEAARKSVEVAEKKARRKNASEDVKNQAKIERETYAALEAQYNAEQKLVQVKEQNRAGIVQQLEATREYKVLQSSVRDLEEKATKRAIINNVAYNTTLVGVANAFKLMKMEIEDSNLALGKTGTAILYVRAGVAALIGLISTLGRAINAAFAIVATVGAVFSVFDSIFSKNEKQARAFDSAIDAVGESINNVTRTVDLLETKGAFGSNLIARANAVSNAFGEIADSAQAAIVAANKAKEAMSGWDEIKDSFFSLFGGGIDKNLAKGLSNQFKSALDLLRREGISEAYETAFKELLNVTDLNTDTVREAILDLTTEGKQRFADLLGTARGELAKTASALQGFKDSTDKAYKSYQEFLQSTANTNPLFKVGADLQTVAMEMVRAMQEGTKGVIAAFEDLDKNPAKAAMFGPEFIAGFVAVKDGFMEQSKTLVAYQQELNKTQAEIKSLRDEEQRLLKLREKSGRPSDPAAAATNLLQGKRPDVATAEEKVIKTKTDELEKKAKALANVIDNVLSKDKIDPAVQLFNSGIKAALAEGARLIEVALGQASVKASLAVAKSTLSALSGERRAEADRELTLKDIDIRITEIKTNISLINQQERLIAAMAANTAIQAEKTTLEKTDSTETQKQAAKDARDAAQLYADFVSGTRTAAQDASEAAKTMFEAQKLGYQNRIAQQKAALIEAQGGKTAADRSGQLAIMGARVEDEQRVVKLQQDINNELKNRRSLLSQITNETNSQIILADAELDKTIMESRQAQAVNEVQAKINQAEYSQSVAQTQADKTRYGNEIAFLVGILNLTKARNKEETANKEIENRIKLLNKELNTIQRAAESEQSRRNVESARAEATLEIDKARFTSQATLLDLDKQFVANRVYDLDLRRSTLDADKQIADANAAYNTKEQQAQATIAALKGEDKAREAEITAELERQKSIRDNQLLQIDIEFEKRNQILNITRQQSLEQAKIAYQMEQANVLASALTGAFGNTGKTLGELSTALVEYEQKQAQNQKQLSYYQDQRNLALLEGSVRTEQLTELNEAEGRAKKKSRDDELTGNAKLLGSAKTLFKQHTGAYKTLAALEKAYHIMRMVNMGIEMVTSIKKAAVEVSSKATSEAAQTMLQINGLMTRMPFMIGEIYGKTFGQLGIFGPPVAAALVALAFGSMGRGKGGGGSFVPNAEQRQATQGTAMGYNEKGEKVQVRRGVFGDIDAKSEAISRGIEKIKETSVDGLSVNNQMLSVLQSIDNGINNTAKSLVRVSGLATGSMFGTVPGTQSGGGLFGTGLFASKTTKEIQDSGIVIQGSFAELASTANKTALEFFEQLKVTKKKWYGKTKTSIENNYKEVDDDVSRYFTQVFTSAGKLIKDVAQRTGTATIDEVNAVLNQALPETKISFRGKTGEEIKAEVEAVLGSLISDVSLAIFDEFEKFADFGEDLLLTVIRVTDTNEKIAQQIKNLGGTIDLLNNFNITEALADAAGGFDEFLQQTEFFRDNFLTEAERLAPVQKALVEDLKKLGLESVDTKDEFKRLVQSIKPVDAASTELYATLLKLAPAFQEVYDEAANTIDKLLLDLVAETNKLESTATPLQTALQDIVTETAKYVEQLDKTSASYEANLKVIARWSKASALKELRGNLQTAYEDRKRELEGSIKTWQDLGKNLDTFLTTLRVGSESILSPQEKYAALFNEYQQTLTNIQSTDQAVAQAAAQALPTVSTNLLKAGAALYGSSQLYQILFDDVEQGLRNAKTIIGTQESETQKLLTETQLRVSPYLFDIKTNTADAATRLNNLVTAISAWDVIDETTLANQLATAIKGGTIAATAVDTSFTAALAAAGTKPIGTPTLPPGAGADSGTGRNPNDGPIDNWLSGRAFTMPTKYSDFNWRNYLQANPGLTPAGIDTEIEAQRHFALYGIGENLKGGSATRDAEIAQAIADAAEAARLAAESNKKLNDGLELVAKVVTSTSTEETDRLLNGLTKINSRSNYIGSSFGRVMLVEN